MAVEGRMKKPKVFRVFLGFSYGFPMDFLWFSIGFPRNFEVFGHVFPWVFLDFSMCFLCPSVSPSVFQGFLGFG